MDTGGGFHYIFLFSVTESVIIGKKRKNSKVPTDTGGGLQYISLFSSKKCNYIKKNVEKAPKSPWIQEAVSITYPSFQSKSVIIQKSG